jgi:hypothetical protein
MRILQKLHNNSGGSAWPLTVVITLANRKPSRNNRCGPLPTKIKCHWFRGTARNPKISAERKPWRGECKTSTLAAVILGGQSVFTRSLSSLCRNQVWCSAVTQVAKLFRIRSVDGSSGTYALDGITLCTLSDNIRQMTALISTYFQIIIMAVLITYLLRWLILHYLNEVLRPFIVFRYN